MCSISIVLDVGVTLHFGLDLSLQCIINYLALKYFFGLKKEKLVFVIQS